MPFRSFFGGIICGPHRGSFAIHFNLGIICGPLWESFPVWGSFTYSSPSQVDEPPSWSLLLGGGHGGREKSPITPPPLPKGILYSPQFRSHQESKMAARRSESSTSRLRSHGRLQSKRSRWKSFSTFRSHIN